MIKQLNNKNSILNSFWLRVLLPLAHLRSFSQRKLAVVDRIGSELAMLVCGERPE